VDAPSDLHDAVSRTIQHLKDDKLERLVVGRGAVDVPAVSMAKELTSLTLELTNGSQVRSISTEATAAIGTRDESYTLTVPSDGSGAVMTANSTLGLLRGLATFEQMWYFHNNVIYTIEAPVKIEDWPAYVSAPFLAATVGPR